MLIILYYNVKCKWVNNDKIPFWELHKWCIIFPREEKKQFFKLYEESERWLMIDLHGNKPWQHFAHHWTTGRNWITCLLWHLIPLDLFPCKFWKSKRFTLRILDWLTKWNCCLHRITTVTFAVKCATLTIDNLPSYLTHLPGFDRNRCWF